MLGSILKQLFTHRTPASDRPAPASPGTKSPAGSPEPAGDEHVFRIDWGLHGLLGLLAEYQFSTVLDIGSGQGEHARLLRRFNKEVYAVDLNREADYVGDFLEIDFNRRFDAIWCSHVLEHQRNVGRFLDKLFACLEENGVLAISVPCHPRSRLVPGHVTTWNAGLLCYNLVLAGFDCREARFIQTVDLSLLVRKRRATGPDIGTSAASGLDLEDGDSLAALARFFPFPVEGVIDAEVLECDWVPRPYALRLPAGAGKLKIVGRFLPPEGFGIGSD
jgi:SAM-dependent methyltransferase